MSGYRGHLLGGIVAFGVFNWLVISYLIKPSFENILLGLAISIAMALWPDVDTNSLGQNIFYGIFLVLDLFFLLKQEYKYAAYIGFFALLPIVGKHRGWTHTWWSAIIIPLPLLAYPYWLHHNISVLNIYFYLSAEVGYFSHLLLDRKW